VTVTTYPTAWAAVADHVSACGVETVFGLPGDDLALLTPYARDATRVVLCRDQRNAAFMATGYALASGRPGVCVLGSGPAVTNALTGVLEARAARVPLIVYAGGTGAAQVGTGAHQELDQVAVMRPLTKWAVRVEHPDRVAPVLDRATLVATAGTPGPVYVELPGPVASGAVTRTAPWRTGPAQHPAPAPDVLAASYRTVRAAGRVLVLVGGGARHRNPDGSIERLASALGAGIAATASGRGVVDERHPLFCGLSGLYAPPPLAALWERADLVVALGSRLEETATFGWPDRAVPVVQITVSERDVATDRPGMAVLADVAHTVAGWLRLAEREPPAPDPGWRDQVTRARADAYAIAADRVAAGHDGPGVAVTAVLSALDRVVPPDRVLVQENGLQDMWSYFFPYWSCGPAAGSVVASEQTSLGFAAAAAVGVACADPARPVVALVGDGAFNLVRSELPTLAGLDVAVFYVVLDNGGYGWLQANLHRRLGPGSRFSFLTAGTSAAHTGVVHTRVTDPGGCEAALREAWAACAAGRSAVVVVDVDIRDVPPGMEDLAGGFPATGTAGDQVRTGSFVASGGED
jgi:acetolactate synthase-1/2/3 large subunit